MTTVHTDASVAIVVDDAALRCALKFSLELDGFTVSCCGSAEAVGAESRCLVLDYDLEGADGLQLLETLRSRGVAVPAVLVATHPTRRLHARAAAADARIVEKPLLTDALAQVLRQALEVSD